MSRVDGGRDDQVPTSATYDLTLTTAIIPEPEAPAGGMVLTVHVVTVGRVAYDPTALDRLSSLVPPPASPIFGARSWDEVFRALDLRLPPDYIAFMDRYGDCEFARWLCVFDFRTLTDEQFTYVPEWMDYYRDLREDSPEDFRLAMWPEPEGFLQWGSTIDGDAMGWMTVGKPEEWPIMIVARHDDEDSPVQETMTEWLVGWASGGRFGSWAFSAESEEHPLICEPRD